MLSRACGFSPRSCKVVKSIQRYGGTVGKNMHPDSDKGNRRTLRPFDLRGQAPRGRFASVLLALHGILVKCRPGIVKRKNGWIQELETQGCKCISQNPSDSALLRARYFHPTRLAPMLAGRRSQRLGSSRHLAPSHVQKRYTDTQSIGGGEVLLCSPYR